MELVNKLVLGAFIVSMIFIMVGHIYRDQVQSVLKKEIITLEKVTFDYWSITHFLLFAFMGFIKPDYALSFFTIGCLFEIFEDFLSSNENTQLVNCLSNPNQIKKHILCNGIQDGYWYGKADDVFSNLLGYVVGQAVRKTFFRSLII